MKRPIRFGTVTCLLAVVAAVTVVTPALPAKNLSTLFQGEEKLQTAAISSQSNTARRDPAKYESIVLHGKVIELGPYVAERHDVAIDEDAGKVVLVLVTDSGEVHPLVKDVRSRGFWIDKRLRDRPMELRLHKFPGLPFVRLMDVYSFKEGKKYSVDYWCTICAITTYQPGPCPCCQDEIELRERLVDEIKPGQ
jgi:hypothetical protein